MIEDEILQNFLNNAVKKAKEQIEKEGKLTVENAIPLLLQSQFNHVLHLDEEISAIRRLMDERFEKIDERFEKIDERFEKIDERFEKIDERFEKIDERFEKISKKIGWLFGIVIGIISLGFSWISILVSIGR